jgi:hypothetical protein
MTVERLTRGANGGKPKLLDQVRDVIRRVRRLPDQCARQNFAQPFPIYETGSKRIRGLLRLGQPSLHAAGQCLDNSLVFFVNADFAHA